MVALKDTQRLALEALRALLTNETGINKVSIDVLDSVNDLPQLLLIDGGMFDPRVPGSGRREIRWDLQLQVFIQRSDLEEGAAKARDIRADLIDRLGGDITIGSTVSRTLWQEPLKIVDIEWGGISYVGVAGILTLIINDAFSYA